MHTKLTLPQQRVLYNALPMNRKMAVKKHCKSCEMRGEGIKDIMKKIGDVLGPVAKELGPKVLKEIIVPLLMNYAKEKAGLSGTGLSPAGGGLGVAGGYYGGKGLSPAGGSLKLAGQGKKMKKGSQEMKDHMARIRAMKKK
jgi:hypothetical protein